MVKLINLVVASVAFMHIAAPPVSASVIQDTYRAHTAACIGLFFSDQAAHAVQCLPNNSANIPAHRGSADPSVVIVPPAPPPPPPPPPEEDDCEDVGAFLNGKDTVLVAALMVAEVPDCDRQT
jgi:hypothetical protein